MVNYEDLLFRIISKVFLTSMRIVIVNIIMNSTREYYVIIIITV